MKKIAPFLLAAMTTLNAYAQQQSTQELTTIAKVQQDSTTSALPARLDARAHLFQGNVYPRFETFTRFGKSLYKDIGITGFNHSRVEIEGKAFSENAFYNPHAITTIGVGMVSEMKTEKDSGEVHFTGTIGWYHNEIDRYKTAGVQFFTYIPFEIKNHTLELEVLAAANFGRLDYVASHPRKRKGALIAEQWLRFTLDNTYQLEFFGNQFDDFVKSSPLDFRVGRVQFSYKKSEATYTFGFEFTAEEPQEIIPFGRNNLYVGIQLWGLKGN